jgi:valyl-tRNA synthetase
MDPGDRVDPDVERKRLMESIATTEAEIERAQGKLANGAFVAKAPPAVVEKERAKLEDHQDNLGKLRAQLERLGG